MPIRPALRGIILILVIAAKARTVRNACMRSLQGISGALHLDIFDRPERIFFAKSSNCPTRQPFINPKASDIISINFPIRIAFRW